VVAVKGACNAQAACLHKPAIYFGNRAIFYKINRKQLSVNIIIIVTLSLNSENLNISYNNMTSTSSSKIINDLNNNDPTNVET